MQLAQIDVAEPHVATQPNILSAISSEMVRIYKDQFGRGPAKTRTNWAGPDILLVTLEKTFTPLEHSLAQAGEHKLLRHVHQLLHNAEIGAFCEVVERLTGRKVRAFVSGVDTETDLASDMFVLHPADYDGPSRVPSAAPPVRSIGSNG